MVNDADNVVRSFWHGSPLSIYEKLSLRSFVNCGHAVELYAYADLDVPSGVTLCDASGVLPLTDIFCRAYGQTKVSVSAFSNLFRYKVLFEKGGIWADADMLCQKSLAELPDACVGLEKAHSVNCALMKFSAGNPICKELYRRAEALGNTVRHAQSGPALLTALLREKKYACDVLPITAFYPIGFDEAWKLIVPSQHIYCKKRSASSFCVHWWGSTFSHVGLSNEALPPEGSFLYEKAKLAFGGVALNAWPAELTESCVRNWRVSRRTLLLRHHLGKLSTALRSGSPPMLWDAIKKIASGCARKTSNFIKRKFLSQ